MTAFSDTASIEPSIERCIIELLASRKPESSICPSDAARALWPDGEQWRDRMDDVRAAAAGLARRGEVRITQGDSEVDIETVKGPIRIRRGPGFTS